MRGYEVVFGVRCSVFGEEQENAGLVDARNWERRRPAGIFLAATTRNREQPYSVYSYSLTTLLLLLLLIAGLSPGCALVYDRVGGAFRYQPEELESRLSPGALRLVEQALEDLDPARRVDYHVHMISPEIHPTWLSWFHPIRRGRTMVYVSAAGAEWENLVESYVERLVRLVRGIPGGCRVLLYALDRYHLDDGTAVPDKTPIYVPNELVFEVYSRHPDIFVPVVSVHPARVDAIVALEKWATRGCRHVKWLPNSMRINPSSPRYDAFYRKMKELGMILLCHTGDESAFAATAGQHLGNPLLLRRPLDLGVRVVALHAASDGELSDLDHPEGRRVPAFELLLRLLENPRYDGLLFADSASITFFNHLERPLRVLLERGDLQRRLVHGSDYPLCAVNLALRTSSLARYGFITDEERKQLNEIYDCNPLLFDLVVKRTLRHPESGQKLLPEAFLEAAELSRAPSGP